MSKKSNINKKEEFCAACVATAAAVAGSTGAGVGAKNYGKFKKIMFWSGISFATISLIVVIYFLTRCEQCRK